MIKLLLMAISVLITMSIAGIAYADHTWTGFYAGMNAGYAYNKDQLKSQHLGFTNSSEHCNINSHFSTFFPGIQLGYAHQFPSDLVSGIEANIAFNTNQKETLSCNSLINSNVYDRFSFSNQMQSLIKGRVGHTLTWNKNIFLPYLTVGASFPNVGLTYKNEGGDYYSKNTTTRVGWLIGTGIEWAFRHHWSWRVEYYFVDYGDAIKLKIPSVYGLIDPDGNARVNQRSHNVVVSINYWI